MTGVKRDCGCPRARHQHGTEQAYISDWCRCPDCSRAHAEKAAWRRRQYAYGRDIAHLVPSAGSARRIQALACLGWSFEVQARRLGCDPVTLHRIWRQPRLISAKAQAISDLYDELWNIPAPETTKGERISARRTRWLARQRAWLPPLAWDDDSIDDPDAEPYRGRCVSAADRGIDEIAVQEAMRGRRVHLYPAEKAEALRRLTERGYSAAAIADRLGTTQRSVVRTRSARGIRGAA